MTYRTYALIALAVLLLASPFLVEAQGLVPCKISQCHICDIAQLLDNITRFFITYVALPGSALLFALGGIMLLISGTSEQRRTQGKTIIWRTVIGIVIILLAWTFVDTLIKTLTGSSNSLTTGAPGGFGPWNEFDIAACKSKL